MTETQIVDGVTDGLSPKAIAAAAAPLLAGIVLMVLDLLKVVDVDDTLWITLLGISPVSGAGAAAAGTGRVKPRSSWSRGRRKKHPTRPD